MKRTLIASAAALCAVVLLSACGSSSSSSSGAAASASGSSRRTALAACLKRHGVSFPARRGGPYGGPPGAGAGGGAPGGAPPAGGIPSQARPPAGGFFFGGGGGRSSTFRAALRACGANALAGRGRRPGFTRATLTKFVACVRAHGYRLPTPNTSGTGPVFPSGIQAQPTFITASRACASLLRPPSGSGSTATG